MEIAPRPQTTEKTDAEIDAGMRRRVGELGVGLLVGAGALIGATGYQASHTEAAPAQQEASTTTIVAHEATSTSQPEEHEAQAEPATWLPEGVKTKWPLINEVARGYGLDPRLVAVIVAEESGGNEHAVNSSGAKGLFQLMPVTEHAMAQKLGYKNYNVYDAKTNLELGCTLIRYLYDHYISPSGLELDDIEAITELTYGMSGGEGDLQNFIRSGSVNSMHYAKQSTAVAKLWVDMFTNWNNPSSPEFEKLRGVQK